MGSQDDVTLIAVDLLINTGGFIKIVLLGMELGG